ncbi:hypothetical protein Goshw_006347 [Gossypium schwendimanii]|uniref:DUF4283 domain-containing protein n=1 Tax=Gossypium schwendimanii TaxID=34291 RepID=A0A7J9NED4_GOSSC|nr:hypothetical protein [Gossypium schwendimanii]
MLPSVKGQAVEDYAFNITPSWIRVYNISFEQMDRQLAIDVGRLWERLWLLTGGIEKEFHCELSNVPAASLARCQSCKLSEKRNRIVMNKETRQERKDVFEGKLSTKAVKEEKTPFDEQIFGTKDWYSQVCKSDLVEKEAKVENELLEQSQLETKHLRTAKFKNLMNDWYLQHGVQGGVLKIGQPCYCDVFG